MGLLEREIDDVKRFEEIMQILFEQGFGIFLSRMNLLEHVPLMKRAVHAQKMPTPERVRVTFERLGPTFIKFGQILAQRPDIVPQPYIEELQKLEDDVPAFDSSVAKDTIAQEIGPVDDIFTAFEDEPIAAASIAQVHRATLQNGDEVVVKVRRPGIKEQMQKDLDILTTLAKRSENHISLLQHLNAYQYVQEFARWTTEELDLKREGHNAQVMQRNLSDEDHITIPDVYTEYTTEKVLVMAYMEGVKCTDEETLQDLDISKKRLARTAIRAGLKQTVRDGFFHADPHPSNFLVSDDGQIIYLDFGMIGKLSKNMRRNLGLLFLHAANEDVEAAITTVKRMATIEDDADLEGLKADIEEILLRVRDTTLQEQSVTTALMEITAEASDRGVHMPPSLALMGKSMVTMEGIGMTLYPEFEMTDEYERVVREILWQSNSPRQMVQTFLIDLLENKDLLTRMPSQINDVLDQGGKDSSTTVIQESSGMEANALLIGALLLSSSLLFIVTLPSAYLLYIGIAELVLAAILLFRQQ
jgi:ubiquinone biosynthesis protein